MKWVRAILSLGLAAAALWSLDSRHGAFPALGRVLDPFSGFWRNGARSDELPGTLTVPGLRAEVRIAWDDRRVPHIFAANDHDLYLAQGYVAAALRLWQMDFQTRYAAGRLSEIVGRAGLRQDIFNRRFGLSWAAEKSVRGFREDPVTREALDAFSAGVNARIRDLGRKGLPLEFKVLGYRPEPWSDLKCALLLKSMAYVLSSYNQDAALTELKERMDGREEVLDRLFPIVPPLVDPVIPPGTPFAFTPVPVAAAPPAAPRSGDRPVPGSSSPPVPAAEPVSATWARPDIGSNNWAVAGSRTASGHPLLCNDMHLELALPAVWYEVQLAAPGVNVRGVAFPAAPLVIAGYNQDIAWGFTNACDDVVDWHAVEFKDATRSEYRHGGEWRGTTLREERIKVRGGPTVVDKVVHTHHGPIVRWPDESPFPGMNVPAGAALRWLAHDPSNEFATLHALNRARGYDGFVEALSHWSSPAQNFVYADREGTIALWHNGKFPLRDRGQGRFVLDGADPACDCDEWVPRAQVPHVKDPPRGFVSSANQMPADEGYPYYLGWDYASYERGSRINEVLRGASAVTPEDMVRMQTDVVDVRARAVLPRLLEALPGAATTEAAAKALAELRAWEFEARAALVAPTVFREFWNELNRLTWDDERPAGMDRMPIPASQVLVDAVLNHPDAEFFDDRATPERETLDAIAARAFRSAVANLEERLGPPSEAWRWGRAKGTRLRHLARIPALGRENIESDGAGGVINAIDAVWAPSWRMVVELGPEVRAWGNYPGGQSGNPGSAAYADRVDDWAAGLSYELVFLKSADEPHPRIVERTLLRGAK